MKFELQHFLLPRRKGRDDAEKKTARLFLLHPFVRRTGFCRFLFDNSLVEISHALFLSADVEGTIAANGEEPFRRGGVGLTPFSSLKFDKGLLDDIARSLPVTEDARGVLQKGQFETAE